MTDDLRLLHEYVHQNSREALDQLIRRHLNLVYSAARRQVGDPHLAEDVTQAVFLVLAKKAGAIRRGVAVAGWLLAVTRCASLDAMRKQAIRQKHERAASVAGEKEVATDEWGQIAPLLDGELNRLGARDRDAVVLRFFQNRSFAQIGAELELTPDAARKPVERAIVRLRGLLARRGVTAPASAIGGAIVAFAVEAAPAHVAAAVASSAIPSGQTISLAQGAIKMMPWAKVKVAEIVAVLLLVVGGSGAAVLNQILAAEPATPAPATSVAAADSAPAVDYLKQSSGPFLEMVGCRIKQNVDLKLSPTTQPGTDADWTDCQYDQVHWIIDPAISDKVADYTISVSSVDGPSNVTTFHADKKSDTQYLRQSMPKPGDYTVKVTADGDDGKALASASANITVNPLPFTQILISDYQLDGLIHCTYVLQHMNDSGQAIVGDDMDYDDTLKVTDMSDELGNPIKFTTTHQGNMFDLKYRLNSPVEPGQPFMVSNLSTIDGLSTKMLRDLGGGEYVGTFKHMNGQSAAIRRIELHILPAGAKLISLMPSDIPTKVVDGRVQVFIDAMIRVGGKITSTIRYRLPEGN